MTVQPANARFPDSDGREWSWCGLHGSSQALAIPSAAMAFAGITLVVTRSSHQAHMLARDIELLSSRSLPVWLFPDHETLPYDPFSPHPDIIADRLRTLAALAAARRSSRSIAS